MHECPECGQACDCDGEDTWHEWDSPEAMECDCGCWLDEEESDEYDEELFKSFKYYTRIRFRETCKMEKPETVPLIHSCGKSDYVY